MLFTCPRCRHSKARSFFPKGHTSMCLSCTRLDSAARRPILHNVHRYKVHACRCAVCRQAMSDYQQARYVPKAQEPIVAPTRSFWLDAPSEGFTSLIEREQAQRLRGSRFGQLNGKPFTIEEVSR